MSTWAGFLFWRIIACLVVVEKPEDLSFNAPDDAEGVIWEGTMYLVRVIISNPEYARRVVLHEFIGHFGLSGFPMSFREAHMVL